jgi:hypothetical protein
MRQNVDLKGLMTELQYCGIRQNDNKNMTAEAGQPRGRTAVAEQQDNRDTSSFKSKIRRKLVSLHRCQFSQNIAPHIVHSKKFFAFFLNKNILYRCKYN